MSSGFIWVIFFCATCGYLLTCILNTRNSGQNGPPLRPGDLLELFVLGACAFVYCDSFILYSGGLLQPWHLPAFLGLLFAICIWKRQPPVPFAMSRRSSLASCLLVLVPIALTFFTLVDGAATILDHPQVDQDMVAHILIKGKIIAHEGLWDSPYFNDPEFANMHSRYPLFAAVIYGSFFQWGPGNFASYLFTNYLVVGGIAAALYSWLRNSTSPFIAALWTTIYITAPDFIYSEFIMSSLDIMLAAAFFCAARHFYEWEISGDNRQLCLAAVFAGAAMLIKDDALIFSLALLSVAALSGARRALWSPTLIWLAIALPWMIVSRRFPDAASGPLSVVASSSLSASLPNLAHALRGIKDNMIYTWHGVFMIAPVVLILSLFRKRNLGITRLLTAILLTLFAYCVIIWLYVGKVDEFLQTFFRLLLPMYPVTLACIAVALNKWADPDPANVDH